MNGLTKRHWTKAKRKRSGFILVVALIIVLLGSALSVGIFALARFMYGTDILHRRSYEEQIDLNSYIEEAKGFIVDWNNKQPSVNKPVLHGRGGLSDDKYFAIGKLSDLQVCTPNEVGNVLSREITLSEDRGVARKLLLQVYDANYRVNDVSSSFVPNSDMPPSLYPTYLPQGGGWTTGTGGVKPKNLYKTYGAYLVRVELFRGGKALRRAEELFFMVVGS